MMPPCICASSIDRLTGWPTSATDTILWMVTRFWPFCAASTDTSTTCAQYEPKV